MEDELGDGRPPSDPASGSAKAGATPTEWPNDPHGLLSAGGTIPIPDHIDPSVYESWYAARDATRVETKVLRYGLQDDGFELVVFGFPISCVPHVAPDLPDQSRRWGAAVDAIETVPTQAMQLWLSTPAPDLAAVDPGIVVGGFVEPFDTWADMVHLVRQERVRSRSRSRTSATSSPTRSRHPVAKPTSGSHCSSSSSEPRGGDSSHTTPRRCSRGHATH